MHVHGLHSMPKGSLTFMFYLKCGALDFDTSLQILDDIRTAVRYVVAAVNLWTQDFLSNIAPSMLITPQKKKKTSPTSCLRSAALWENIAHSTRLPTLQLCRTFLMSHFGFYSCTSTPSYIPASRCNYNFTWCAAALKHFDYERGICKNAGYVVERIKT